MYFQGSLNLDSLKRKSIVAQQVTKALILACLLHSPLVFSAHASDKANLQDIVKRDSGFVVVSAVGASCTVLIAKQTFIDACLRLGFEVPEDMRFKDDAILIARGTSQALVPVSAVSGWVLSGDKYEIISGPTALVGRHRRINANHVPGYMKGMPTLPEPQALGEWRPLPPYDILENADTTIDLSRVHRLPGDGVFNRAHDDWIIVINGTAGALDGKDVQSLFAGLYKAGMPQMADFFFAALTLSQ